MPAPKDHTPKYRLHKGSGQALVQLYGERKYLGVYGSEESWKRYDDLITEWRRKQFIEDRQARVETETSIPPRITVTELCAHYYKFAQGYYRKDGEPTGQVGIVAAALRPLRELFGTMPAAELGPLKLKAYQQHLVRLDLARTYLNKLTAVIQRAYRWAVSEELLSASVSNALDTVTGLAKGRTEARESDPVLPVADELVDATLAKLPPVVADMVRVQRLTGCRPNEVCMMRPCDVDRSQGEVWVYRPRSHKNSHRGHDRIIAMGPKARAILAPYLLNREPDAECFSPAEADEQRRAAKHATRKTPLSCGNRPKKGQKARPARKPSDAYETRSYATAIRYACLRAFPCPERKELARLVSEQMTEEAKGKPKKFKPSPLKARRIVYKARPDLVGAVELWKRQYLWSPNQLRHAAATEARKLFGIESASTMLGHARLDTTQIYAEKNLTLAIELAKKLG
jgi:integrase